MEGNEFLTQSEILSDVLMLAGDTELKKGITKGWYVSRIQQAIEKLAISTFYEVLTSDFDTPKNFVADLPINCFNIREVYLFNGGCCQAETSVIVHFKRLFNNKPGSQADNYTALRSDLDTSQASDPFYEPFLDAVNYWAGPYAVYYANIQNGKIMFSSNAAGFDKYRIVYNGFGGNIGDPPLIPRMLREVVVDLVSMDAFGVFMAREPRTYLTLFREYKEKLYNYRDGSFWEAKKRIATLDTWKKTDMEEYQRRGDW